MCEDYKVCAYEAATASLFDIDDNFKREGAKIRKVTMQQRP